ncbi:IS110 family transposase [Thalassobaculum sp.]|uniref:IS110 family transposase n=1 Tax=Thalassobaculum sp. TaxID=2022740 RepID=UPI0032EE1323
MPSTCDRCQSSDGPAVLGLDVGKSTVTLYDARSGRSRRLRNTAEDLLEVLRAYAGYDLAVCEATGGYEDVLLATLLAVGIPAHRADAVRVRAFLRSHGTLAKTDPIDARGLARYGQDRFATLACWTPAEAAHDEFVVLVERRRDLVDLRVSEKNRLQAPRAAHVADDIASLIDELSRRIGEIENRITMLIESSQRLQRLAETLRSVSGIGPTIAAVMIAGLPELGRLSRREIASLAGLAPHPRDSGTIRGHRTTRGGRRALRPSLFLAALTASRGTGPLADTYNRLLAAGKPKRLALVAIARKIVVIANAKVRDLLNQTASPEA